MAHHRRRHRARAIAVARKGWRFSRTAGIIVSRCAKRPISIRSPVNSPGSLGLAIVMAVTGPFGLYGYASLGVRLVYFGTTAVLIWLQVLGFALLLSQIEALQRWSIAARMALAGVLAAIPGTIEIIVLSSWLVRPTPFRAALEIYPADGLPDRRHLGDDRPVHRAAPARQCRQRAGARRRPAGGRRARERRARLLPPRAAGARPRSSGPGDGGPLPAHPHRARQRSHPAAPA